MPVFNRAKVLEAALLALFKERAEDYPNLEILVIDGGSTDGTVEVIRKYADQIQYWVSEKDSGASEAFNKGVQASHGQIIRYIASDDMIVPGTTRQMMAYLTAHPDIDVLGGLSNCYKVEPGGELVLDPRFTSLHGGWLTLDEVITWCARGVFAYLETWFFRREVLMRVGGLDTRYRICPDIDLAFRLVKAGCRFYVASYPILNKYHYADGTNLVANTERMFREHRAVIRAHARWSWKAQWMLYNLPAPLHSRIFWGGWLKTLGIARRTCPAFCQRMQTLKRFLA